VRNELAVVVVAILGAGCGGGSSPNAQAADAASNQQEAGAPLPYCTSKPPLTSVTDLSGTWVARLAGSQHVRALGTDLYPMSVGYILVTISQSGTAIVADGRYCDRIEKDPPGSLVPVVIPDKWAHTEKPVHRTGTFVAGSDGVPLFTLDPSVEVAGAVLADPNDPLPTKPTDLTVIDEDNDGHPGITIDTAGIAPGSMYSVQRQTTSAVGIPVAADRIEGVLSYLSSQVVLESDPASLATLYAAGTTLPDLTACDSTFAMVKVEDAPVTGSADGGDVDGGGAIGSAIDAGAITCSWVRANETVLFP